MVSHLLSYSEKRSKPFLLALGYALIALLGVIDYVTGYELSLAIFYLLPIALLSWSVGRRAGIVSAIVTSIVFQWANHAAGQIYNNPFAIYWNTTTRIGFFVTVVFLLSQLREALEHERDLARTDHLTGAANTRAFHELAHEEIKRAQRNNRAFSIVYMDVDDFKIVNDRLGHSAGDTLLRMMADTIKSDLRSNDVVARLGGDEFAILLPETAYGPAAAVIRRIQNKLLEEVRKNQWPVTFSIGALTCVGPPNTVEDMIRMADTLMYSVKNDGKNTIKHEILEAAA